MLDGLLLLILYLVFSMGAGSSEPTANIVQLLILTRTPGGNDILAHPQLWPASDNPIPIKLCHFRCSGAFPQTKQP